MLPQLDADIPPVANPSIIKKELNLKLGEKCDVYEATYSHVFVLRRKLSGRRHLFSLSRWEQFRNRLENKWLSVSLPLSSLRRGHSERETAAALFRPLRRTKIGQRRGRPERNSGRPTGPEKLRLNRRSECSHPPDGLRPSLVSTGRYQNAKFSHS